MFGEFIQKFEGLVPPNVKPSQDMPEKSVSLNAFFTSTFSYILVYLKKDFKVLKQASFKHLFQTVNVIFFRQISNKSRKLCVLFF